MKTIILLTIAILLPSCGSGPSLRKKQDNRDPSTAELRERCRSLGIHYDLVDGTCQQLIENEQLFCSNSDDGNALRDSATGISICHFNFMYQPNGGLFSLFDVRELYLSGKIELSNDSEISPFKDVLTQVLAPVTGNTFKGMAEMRLTYINRKFRIRSIEIVEFNQDLPEWTISNFSRQLENEIIEEGLLESRINEAFSKL